MDRLNDLLQDKEVSSRRNPRHVVACYVLRVACGVWRVTCDVFQVSSFLLATSPDWMCALGIEEEDEAAAGGDQQAAEARLAQKFKDL